MEWDDSIINFLIGNILKSIDNIFHLFIGSFFYLFSVILINTHCNEIYGNHI